MIDVWFKKNVVLIADLHIGAYKGESYVQKIVWKLREINDIDAILIAWDLTYNPKKIDAESLEKIFSAFSQIQIPVFFVLGNHDIEKPWPDLRKNLVDAMTKNWAIFLHNDVYALWNVNLVGLWPHLWGEDRVTILDQFSKVDNVLVLTHNPDTTRVYKDQTADVTLVWHTHCGQIRFPFIQDLIRPHIYPVVGDFDCGLYKDSASRLYITPWLWEVILPMRLLNPPQIDILRLR